LAAHSPTVYQSILARFGESTRLEEKDGTLLFDLADLENR